ncbi:tyrosyl-DNA phosphodiesterase domain-containing protein [Ditylenchus destructor]|nr:tyrosyl-DNA phosphodiesterase domain-containing protein [Ditylenchus destructor]
MKRSAVEEKIDEVRSNVKVQKVITIEDDEELKSKPSTSGTTDVPHSKRILKDGIYFVKIKGVDENDCDWAITLFQLIDSINPIASIHFNYCIDPHFVLKQYPRRCRSSPITLIVGLGHKAILAEECEKYENVTVGAAAIPFQYCTHHSKLSLFESENAIHVMISTANLLDEDYGLKTQAFYYCSAPFIASSEELTFKQSKFGEELIEYLEEAYSYDSPSHRLVNYWSTRMKQADFRHIRDRIIASVPGRYSGSKLSRFGHMKLRRTLAEKFSADELDKQKLRIGQFSSIGSLGAQPQAWLCDEFLTSLTGKNSMISGTSLKLIYPSVENVRCSLEGWEAGGSLPYNSATNSKQPYLRFFLHQWKSDKLKRTRAMPHVKSYTALDADNKPQWLLVTSANLSHSAWGKLEKDRTQLFCRAYELGVLLCLKDHPEYAESGFRLPFDIPLEKYSTDDKPFLVDVPYNEPDSMGCTRIR